MQFKATTIAPEGRNKYGNYIPAGNVTKKVAITTYSGNDTTGGDGPVAPAPEEEGNFIITLSKNSNSFDGQEVSLTAVTDSVNVIAYRGTSLIEAYVGSITGTTASGGTAPADYSITGLTTGLTVNVLNNGTTGATLQITVDSGITKSSGTLTIPISICTDGSTGLGDDISAWEWEYKSGSTMTMALEYAWSVTRNASSAYVLNLTNDSAGINCNSGGTILPGAIRPTCTASLYYGSDPVTGATYGISYPSSQNVQGVSINSSTGVLTFGSNFQFVGTSLEVTVTASLLGHAVATKIMTITKSFPGADGIAAITRWIVLSADAVHYNPNTESCIPDEITAKVMAQSGESAIYEDNTTTIYYGYDTETPGLTYTGAVTVDVSKEYLSFALKTGSTIYELETIPILKDGINGTMGQSVYRLDLDNQNASINADSAGTIYAGAVRPTCTATLYYGDDPVTGVVYSISTTATGVSINSSTGVLTFGSNFNFNGTSTEITISAKVGGVLKGTAIMTVSKSMAGADGTPAVSYWLVISANAVQVTSGGTANPSSISAVAMMQEGEDTPATATTAVIKYGYNTTSPSSGNTYTASLNTIDTNKNYITFRLLVDNVQRDIETVPINKDGKDGTGTQGRQGAAVRGPVNWYDQTTVRRFCNGQYTSASYPEDALWIDVILKDDVYYYCNTSYNGSANDSWASVSSNWTSASTQFNFIASNLLLANNAAINFLTNNELYLRDSNNNITAGAAGGSGITFWAGSDTPSDAPFKVYADGTMMAQNGMFGGFLQMPYVDVSSAYTRTSGTYYLDTGHTYIALNQDGYNSMTIVLPAPSAALNGFVYNFINIPGMTKNERYTCNIQTTNNANVITNWTQMPYDSTYPGEGARAIVGAGYYQLVCMKFNNWHWAIIQATGNMKLYSYSGGSYTDLNIWQSVSSKEVNKLVRGSGTDTTALYFTE